MLNNEITVDPKVIADGFNNFFINIGPTLASKINTFFLEPTNTNEVKQVINNLKDGAPGRDGILPKHLKYF